MGIAITNQDGEYIKTSKNKYALEGLRELEGLNCKVYEEGTDRESVNREKKKKIEDYIFDVIRIDKQGNENIDFVDIFIRLNQNPCPIKINSFEMWNSFEIVNTIKRVKEIAQYKAFKQQGNAMKEEELVTILAYMDYKGINISNIYEFFKINLRTDNRDTKWENSLIKVSVRNKNAITNLLEKMKPNSEEEKEFLKSVETVNDFVEKLKILSDNDEKKLIKILNSNNSTKKNKNCFYIMWLILRELDTHRIQTYKKEIFEDLEQIFKLMQNMPKDKDEKIFIGHVRNMIDKHCK